MSTLPIQSVLPEITATLERARALVLQAPPGAGKTTMVPLALLDAPWLAGQKIILLEPRRLAARAAAARMADLLGEDVGGRVGYRIRMESKIGPATRIEVVTEGILTRMLLDDPGLDGIGAVIFDEFHERSLHADLGLALCLESRSALRPDLGLVVMSATLDGGPVAALLGDAPLITSEGRAFPVETHFTERPNPRRLGPAIAAATAEAAEKSAGGNILVFLPGQGEIRAALRALSEASRFDDFEILPLYGDLSRADQDRALAPAPQGPRRIILATAIAETSLTIPGVSAVVDSGLMRVPSFDPLTGMTRLTTLPVSRASADQRRGRAGRLGPGVCVRLWTAQEDRALAPFTAPEILDADLAPLALDLACWGARDVTSLPWLDAPPAAALTDAQGLLADLGAVNAQGALTPHGRAMHRLGLHPRLGHMALMARTLGLGGLACELAALLGERDIVKAAPGQMDTDIRLRVEALRSGRGFPGLEVDRGALARARDGARDLRRRLNLKADAEAGHPDEAGVLLAHAYPDRIAKRRGTGSAFQMSRGGGAAFRDRDALAAQDWLVIPELDGDRREARIFLAAPLTEAEVEAHFAALIRDDDIIAWDRREQVVTALRQRRLGKLVMAERRLTDADPMALVSAMADGIRDLGLNCLPWSREAESLRQRLAFAARYFPEDGWPDVTDAALLDGLEDWLGPYLNGVTRRAHLDKLNLAEALAGSISWDQKRALDSAVPSHLTVPTGNRIALDYAGDVPVLAVRLQELFGCAETPRIAHGKVPVLLHLLSPARRPLQVTADLAGFWRDTYKAVKAEMKGQYPRHYWPDDPMQAEPTARAKPRGT